MVSPDVLGDMTAAWFRIRNLNEYGPMHGAIQGKFEKARSKGITPEKLKEYLDLTSKNEGVCNCTELVVSQCNLYMDCN